MAWRMSHATPFERFSQEVPGMEQVASYVWAGDLGKGGCRRRPDLLDRVRLSSAQEQLELAEGPFNRIEVQGIDW